VSRDGQKLAVGFFNKRIRIWDKVSGSLTTSPERDSPVLSISWSPREQKIATVSSKLTAAQIWDVAVPVLDRWQGHADIVNNVAWSPDGKALASMSTLDKSSDNTIRVWDPMSLELLGTIQAPRTAHVVCWSTNGSQLHAIADVDVTTWSWPGGDLVGVTNHRCSLSVSKASDRYCVVTESEVQVHEFGSGSVVSAQARSIRGLEHLSFNPKEDHIAHCDGDGSSIQITNTITGETCATPTNSGPTTAIAWHPKGTHVASITEKKLLTIWSVNDVVLTKLWSVHGHTNIVSCLDWSPDGACVATGSWDRTVAVWSVANMENVAVLTGHRNGVTALSWSPDGCRIATGSADKSVRVWNWYAPEV
jgi:WD40 repeat protein